MGAKGGAAPSKPQATAEENALAEQGVNKYNRYIDRYAPLEDASIAAASRPTQNLQAGRTNADLMQEVSDDAMSALGTGNVGQGISTLNRLTGALGSAGAAGRTEAILGERAERDRRLGGAIQTGIGMTGRSQSALGSLASSAGANALNRYSAEVSENINDSNANVAALTSLAQGAAGLYAQGRQQNALSQQLGRSVYQNRYGGTEDLYGRLDGSSRLY